MLRDLLLAISIKRKQILLLFMRFKTFQTLKTYLNWLGGVAAEPICYSEVVVLTLVLHPLPSGSNLFRTFCGYLRMEERAGD